MNEKKVKGLQNEAKKFLTEKIIVLKGVTIIPKEIEVYYYKEGEFEDKSVHRNELQKNNKNHFYVHRWGTNKGDKYKGSYYPGVDFVVSDDDATYYSYLIRSAVINGTPIYGPNNVLNEIKRVCCLEDNAELEKQYIENKSCNIECKSIIYTQRYGLGNNVDDCFRKYKLRFVVLDKDFKNARYQAKEQIVLDYLEQSKSTKVQAETFCKDYMTYLPSKVKEYYANEI
ncbi:MAG: hypothetical protein J6Y24_13170 [Bacteroidales bacterium]|nr:hypothetical protein [Bacteroidales bacterium]